MNIWTTLLYSLLLVGFSCPLAASGKHIADLKVKHVRVNPAKLNYRKATLSDLDEINALFKNASAEDEEKLLILPEPFRTHALRDAIGKGRFFVALHLNTIVSVVKLFVMGTVPDDDADDSEIKKEAEREESRILEDELRCRPGCRQYRIKMFDAGIYTCPYSLFLRQIAEPKFKSNSRLRFLSKPEQTYVYFGSAFTRFEYRENYINTFLERFGLDQIKYDILKDIVTRHSEQLFYVYGTIAGNVTVNANNETATNTQHVRVFADFVQWIKLKLQIPANIDDEDLVQLRFFMFNTHKPAFVTQKVKGEYLLNRLADQEENAGFGIVIECPLPNARYPRKITKSPPSSPS